MSDRVRAFREPSSAGFDSKSLMPKILAQTAIPAHVPIGGVPKVCQAGIIERPNFGCGDPVVGLSHWPLAPLARIIENGEPNFSFHFTEPVDQLLVFPAAFSPPAV